MVSNAKSHFHSTSSLGNSIIRRCRLPDFVLFRTNASHLRSTARSLDGDLFTVGALRRVVIRVTTDRRLGMGHFAGSVHLRQMGEGGLELQFLQPGGNLYISTE